MTQQIRLFYSKNYTPLLQELQSTTDPSMQEIHNLSIVKFLANGESPLATLQKLADGIKSESSETEAWPLHPSWPLLSYHLALIHLHLNHIPECTTILNNLWSHISSIDRFIGLNIALLSIELAIRTTETAHVTDAFAYISQYFPTPDSIATLLKSKGIDDAFSSRLQQTVQFAKLRYDITSAIRSHDDSTQKFLESVLSTAEISPDAKNRTTLPLPQALPLAAAALYMKDLQKFNTILESSDSPTHFAILNNKGIYELLQRRYSSALLHFSRALNASNSKTLVYPFHQVVYNIALPLLLKKKPKKAFQYFHSIIPLMSSSPYLWFRLAECCVLYYKQRVAKLRQRNQISPVAERRLATESRVFYILPVSDFKLFQRHSGQTTGSLCDLNLDFAEKCARNCISLCKEDQSGLASRARLLCSFICLELGDGNRAVEMGKAISSESISENQQFLAKIYTAQGYFLTGNTEKASQTLSPLLLQINLLKDKELVAAYYLTFSRISMAGNDPIKARGHLSKVMGQGDPRPEVHLTTIAYELQEKNTQKALDILKSFTSKPSE